MTDLKAFITGTAKTYKVDEHLFKDLKLKPFITKASNEIFVGQCNMPRGIDAQVKVWVTCMPAQFWKVEITKKCGTKYIVETGSGSLTSFWQMIILIANGMIEVNKVLA